MDLILLPSRKSSPSESTGTVTERASPGDIIPDMLKARVLPLFFALTIALPAQTKRPLNHRDYDGWSSIAPQVLSRDGKFLAYGLFPEDGDGQLVVRNLATGKEIHEGAGAIPPSPDPSNLEGPAPDSAPVRGIQIAFTHDGRYIIAGSFPSKAEMEKAKRDRKRPDEMPRNGMIIVDTATLTATHVA